MEINEVNKYRNINEMRISLKQGKKGRWKERIWIAEYRRQERQPYYPGTLNTEKAETRMQK
jgi:hypothetical protein